MPASSLFVAVDMESFAALRINQLTMRGNIAPLAPDDILSQAPVVTVKAGETVTADVRAARL